MPIFQNKILPSTAPQKEYLPGALTLLPRNQVFQCVGSNYKEDFADTLTISTIKCAKAYIRTQNSVQILILAKR